MTISHKQNSNTTKSPRSLKQYISLRKILSFYLTIGIPLLYLYNLLLIINFSNTLVLSLPLVVLGVAFSFLGISLWAISMFHLGKSFGVLPKKQKRIKRGVYKYLSHPMYVGIILTFTGLGLANRSKQGLLFAVLILAPLLAIRAYVEQRKLI